MLQYSLSFKDVPNSHRTLDFPALSLWRLNHTDLVPNSFSFSCRLLMVLPEVWQNHLQTSRWFVEEVMDSIWDCAAWIQHVSADVSIAAQQFYQTWDSAWDPQISTVPSQGAPCPDTFEAQSDPLQQNRFGCSVAHWLSQVRALREPCKPSRTCSVSTNP